MHEYKDKQPLAPELPELGYALTPYDCLNDKMKKINRTAEYSHIIVNDLVSMFEWDNLPEGLDEIFIEEYLNTNGAVLIAPRDKMVSQTNAGDGYIAFPSQPSGTPDAYGIGTEGVGASPVGSFHGKIGEDCVVGFNNNRKLPSYNIAYGSFMLAEIDKSIEVATYWTRFNRVPVARDNVQAESIKTVLKNVKDGKLETIIDKNVLEEYLEGVQGINIIDFTESEKSDKIQYLSKLHDDYLRRLYGMYGINMDSTGKMAQQSIEEIQGGAGASFIIPLDMLKQRQKLAEDMNNLFDLNVSVHFSPVLQLEYQKYISAFCPNNENEVEEATEEASEEVSELASEDASEDATDDSNKEESEE